MIGAAQLCSSAGSENPPLPTLPSGTHSPDHPRAAVVDSHFVQNKCKINANVCVCVGFMDLWVTKEEMIQGEVGQTHILLWLAFDLSSSSRRGG